MIPKAYRWVGEMHEISGFVGGGEGMIHEGMSKIYERVERALEEDNEDIDVLKDFVEGAKRNL